MIVTKQWFFSHVNAGSPNNKQLALFGLKWPLSPGWFNLIEGREISELVARQFEAFQIQKSAPVGIVRGAKSENFAEAEFSVIGALYKSPSGLCACDLPPWEICGSCPDAICSSCSK